MDPSTGIDVRLTREAAAGAIFPMVWLPHSGAHSAARVGSRAGRPILLGLLCGGPAHA